MSMINQTESQMEEADIDNRDDFDNDIKDFFDDQPHPKACASPK